MAEQSDPAVEDPRPRTQVPIGEREVRPDVELLEEEMVQPILLVPQQPGQVGQRPVRTCRELRRDDAQRDGNPAAEVDDALGGLGIAEHAPVVDRLAQELRGLPGIERADLHPVRPWQPGQPALARHDHRAVPAAGQQRQHLLLRAHIVQHDEQAPLGQEAAIQVGAFLDVRRDHRGRRAERAQETAEHAGRGVVALPEIAAVQVDEELAVREVGGRLVRRAERDGGLARAGGARDDDDGSGAVGHVREHGVDPRQQLFPSREIGDRRGKLPGHDRH